MAEPERLAHVILLGWARREQLVDLAVTEAADMIDQVIALARDEERAKRCPGCGAAACLRVRDGGCYSTGAEK